MKKQSKYKKSTRKWLQDRYRTLTETGTITDVRTMQAWDVEIFLCGKCNKKNISIMALKTFTQEGKKIVQIKLMCRACLNQVTVSYNALENDNG